MEAQSISEGYFSNIAVLSEPLAFSHDKNSVLSAKVRSDKGEEPADPSLSVITGDEEVSTFTSGGGAGTRAAEDLLLGFPAAFPCFWVSAKPSQMA